jgi:NAD(P)-dependent dehydrogenase (short-subunit alcohol dehydrogenase family)
MSKTILLTGASDGIGLETAKRLISEGHKLLVHGRSAQKLDAFDGAADRFVCDLSDLSAVAAFGDEVAAKYAQIDVLINNAGVFKVANSRLADGQDVRFVVNTLAPYILTRKLLPVIPASGRVINLSSAAQAPVSEQALRGAGPTLSDGQAYAMSKLAITMWSMALAEELGDAGPAVIPVNPGSLLASKMVKEAFGIHGSDLFIGADILCRLSLDAEFAEASGQYYDNDIGAFGPPHGDALNAELRTRITKLVTELT